ncbi:5'/3'-nucleotidase SurE [Cognatishimia sp. WU-CL00825]|uniref:5'/3'-nucleotidase SurE n=1 Tax=Cognatishimia sp. WU-CL00825 TaxID=3127658 RepID=UPI00310AA996
MRILITNDDGINAPGLAILEAIAKTVAGPDGEVWTVAPAFEQSGVGHCISYTHPTMIAKMGERRFAAEGSPADCVLAGLYDVMADAKPNLVLSGVNRGNNSAENTLYSGTIGAAMEAALQSIPALALSQYYGPDNAGLENPFEAAAAFGADVVQKIMARHRDDGDAYKLFYNVNFPPVPAAAVKGIKVVAQGRRSNTNFSVQADTSPTGRRFLWVRGGDQRAEAAENTDANVNLDGYISVTPMRADLTAHDMIASLKDLE